jgi:hypothetical protein
MLSLQRPYHFGIVTGMVFGALFGLTTAGRASVASTGPTISTPTLAFQSLDWLGKVNPAPQLLAQQQQPRTALVIGNADYGAEDSLEGPTNDAQAMYEQLRALGFDVPPPLLNATKQEIEQALRDFAQRMRPGGMNVFYYSGHGVQVDGVNYLMPVGLAPTSSQVDVQYNAVRLDYVVAQMFSVVYDFNFLIIDACRNNPYYSRWGRPKGPGNEGLTSTRPPRGTMIAYAAEENEVAIDGEDDGYSPFTASLLNYLDQPGITIYDLLHNVQRDVETSTDGTQIPSWEGYPKDSAVALNPSTTATTLLNPVIQSSEPGSPVQPSDEPPPPPPDLQRSGTGRDSLLQLSDEPPPPSRALISAATGVNYQPLQDALAAGDFRLADQTTRNLMQRAAGRELEPWLTVQDLTDFSCEDLKVIDQLWLDYSDGKFGFSVQQQIYQRLGGTLGVHDSEILTRFGDEVGWRQNNTWLAYPDSTFSTSASRGHFPALGLAERTWTVPVGNGGSRIVPLWWLYLPVEPCRQGSLRASIFPEELFLPLHLQLGRRPGRKKARYYINIPLAKKRLAEDPSRRRLI